MPKEAIPRLDDDAIREKVLPYCRLKQGEIWEDPLGRHRIGVLDATSNEDCRNISNGKKIDLFIQDPPYNIAVGNKNTNQLSRIDIENYIEFSENWIGNSLDIMSENSHLYVWLGADQKRGFQPLPEFMILMRKYKELTSRSFISLRNQRGYGTQKNWMAVRQELLYYTKGDPYFKVAYTDIPKVLKGYYKTINGKITDNLERGKSDTIRPGNIWLDIQQVFYRMEENIPGAYAQKPLKSIERIIQTSSKPGDMVADFFAHSGTTLIAAEKLDRRCITFDRDPVFAELTIRRLERFRETGKTGWQWENPFPEITV
ncbi:MAG: site-specific DNA-methyltransferase [Spirochaetales bacterium]|nr:site-specific DNA-methyltransferase [Spirochaetales bacterium]